MSDNKWKLITGCCPCNFVFDCCGRIYYRCATSTDMYAIVDQRSNGFQAIKCGTCHAECDYPECNVVRNTNCQ